MQSICLLNHPHRIQKLKQYGRVLYNQFSLSVLERCLTLFFINVFYGLYALFKQLRGCGLAHRVMAPAKAMLREGLEGKVYMTFFFSNREVEDGKIKLFVT